MVETSERGLTLSEARGLTKLSVETLYALEERGILRVTRLGPSRTRIYHPGDVALIMCTKPGPWPRGPRPRSPVVPETESA